MGDASRLDRDCGGAAPGGIHGLDDPGAARARRVSDAASRSVGEVNGGSVEGDPGHSIAGGERGSGRRLDGDVDRLDLPTSAHAPRIQQPHVGTAVVGEVDATASIDRYGGSTGCASGAGEHPDRRPGSRDGVQVGRARVDGGVGVVAVVAAAVGGAIAVAIAIAGLGSRWGLGRRSASSGSRAQASPHSAQTRPLGPATRGRGMPTQFLRYP